MNTLPEPKQKSTIVSISIKIIVVCLLLPFVFIFLKDGISFINYTPARTPFGSRELYKILKYQESFYAEHGKFAKKYSDLSSRESIASQEYNEVGMRDMGNRLFVYTYNKHTKKDKVINTFGIIKLTKDKYNQRPNQSKSDRNYFTSLICSSEHGGTQLPSDIEVVNTSDRCPIGYTKYFVERDTEYIPLVNLRNIVNHQLETYKKTGSFTKNLTDKTSIIKDKYRYQIQMAAGKIIISAQPQTLDISPWVTYLGIATVRVDKEKIFVAQYCESETPKTDHIPSISSIDELSKDCPIGYKIQF